MDCPIKRDGIISEYPNLMSTVDLNVLRAACLCLGGEEAPAKD